MGRRNAARRADAQLAVIAELRLHSVTQREYRRNQRNRRAIVGMPARISLRREVLRHRNLRRQLRLFFGDFAAFDKLAQKFFRRRRQELRRHFHAGNFGEHVIRRDDAARRIAVNAMRAVADNRQRQAEKRRRADMAETAPQIQIGDRLFQVRLVRAVNQVEAIRQIAEIAGNTVKRGFDGVERQSGRAEKANHAMFAHLFNDVGGRDGVRHRSGGAGVTQAVFAQKIRIAKLFRRKRRRVTEKRQRVRRRRCLSKGRFAIVRGGKEAMIIHKIKREAEARERVAQRGVFRDRRRALRRPAAQLRLC